MKNKFLFSFLLASFLSFAQVIPNQQQPPSWTVENLSSVKPYKLPSFNLKALQDEDLINDKDKSKPWRFGHDIYVDHDFNDVGKWTTLPNGDKIWRMSYKSEGAVTLNFMFDIFYLPEGSKLYVYNDEKNDVLRPFTHYNNTPEEILGTWMVYGDQAWIEYYQPASVTEEAKLTLGSVVHGYRTIDHSGNSPQKALNDSGPCNVDVNCDITSFNTSAHDIKENVKSSVGMIVVGGGTGICSGALVNNTNNDGTPYFLTANHCLGGSVAGWAYRFNWASDASVADCATFAPSVDNSFNQTTSGGILRASSSESDMALIEITDTSFFTTNASNLVWAGWNRSTSATPSLTVGIHHPSGDIQKVCVDVNAPTRQAINFNGNPSTEIWRVADWDLGVTEPGSSGSPLFDQNGLVIGKLSGGFAACSGVNDNNTEDWYGRFGVAWDFGSNASSRLRDWLDPGNSGVTTLEQFPPLTTFDNDASVSAGSNDVLICNEDFTPEVTLINRGNLPLTSASITYSFDSEPATTINWTGNLAQDASTVVASPTYSNLDTGGHVFSISVSNPNGVVDENTSDDNFTFNFEVSPDYSTNSVVFNISTDDYAGETSWELRDSSGTLVESGPVTDYMDNTTYQETISIASFNECYTFTILDSYGDGICCGFGFGAYDLQDGDGNIIISGGDFGASESVRFRALNPLSINEFDLASSVNLYPNPVKDNLNVELKTSIDASYEIVNMLGQTISKGKLNASTINSIDFSQRESGVYFIKINNENQQIAKKIIKK